MYKRPDGLYTLGDTKVYLYKLFAAVTLLEFNIFLTYSVGSQVTNAQDFPR